MKKVDQALHDAIISYQIDLRRFEAGARKRVLGILDQLKKELTASLSKQGEITAYSRARKNALLRQISLVIDDYHKRAQAELALNIDGLVDAQVRHVAKMMEGTIAVGMTAALPTKAVVDRIAGRTLIEGGTMAGWWAKISADTSFRVSNAIRQGTVQGETNAQIISRISNKRGESPGVLDTARHNIAALVQTSMQTIANDSRLAVFESNADMIKAFSWFSALDGHVCPRCIAMSGKRWTNGADGSHKPIGHTVPFRNPPIHWNDRCVLLPITKSFKELGVDVDEVPSGQRASKYGPVDSKTTFDDFLRRQSVAEQNEQLGTGRAQLWRDGKITLSHLIDGNGRELTLAELRAKYD